MQWFSGVFAACILIGQTCVAAQNNLVFPRHFAYVLQAEALGDRASAVTQLTQCGRDLIVLDVNYDGNEDGRWTMGELANIRAGLAGRKVVAYLSIGEAEDYRPYWQPAWKNDGPDWLGAANPDWPGNYRVKYWHHAWQALMLAQLDALIAQGFDGVYLDIVDGFETFERVDNHYLDHRINDQTHRTYRQDMIAWIERLAEHARRKNASFMVIPQNGSQLLADAKYLQTISAIGVEDLFTDGRKAQSADHVQFITGYLRKMMDAGKPVLVIEYAQTPGLRQRVMRESGQRGYGWLLTDRSLKTLGDSSK